MGKLLIFYSVLQIFATAVLEADGGWFEYASISHCMPCDAIRFVSIVSSPFFTYLRLLFPSWMPFCWRTI